MREIKNQLGRAANARPFGKGLRFTPTEEDEYRLVQRYFTELEKTDKISWFCYSLPAERSLKVAIRGLPSNATPEEVEEELRELGYDPEYVRDIRARRGRPGCILLAILRRTKDITPGIYEVTEMLGIPGVKIEAWRGKRRPAQCHRCQKFRHSSHHCHRTLACVRCGGEHTARECPRPREEPATCANCGGEHPANHINCPVFKREARNKKAGTVAVTEEPRKPAPVNSQPSGEAAQGSSLMAKANDPPARGSTTSKKRGRRNRKRGNGGAPATNTPLPTTDTKLKAKGGSGGAPAHIELPTQPAAHPVAAPAGTTAPKGRKAKAPQTREGTRSPGTVQAAIAVLQSVLTALGEGRDKQDIVAIILKGLADLVLNNNE